MYSLAELPECRMEIASNKPVLEQLIAVITTKTYKYIASLVSVAGMLCLAYRYVWHLYMHMLNQDLRDWKLRLWEGGLEAWQTQFVSSNIAR